MPFNSQPLISSAHYEITPFCSHSQPLNFFCRRSNGSFSLDLEAARKRTKKTAFPSCFLRQYQNLSINTFKSKVFLQTWQLITEQCNNLKRLNSFCKKVGPTELIRAWNPISLSLSLPLTKSNSKQQLSLIIHNLSPSLKLQCSPKSSKFLVGDARQEQAKINAKYIEIKKTAETWTTTHLAQWCYSLQ